MITEIRRYRLDPERLDTFLEFFSAATKQHVDRGMRVEYVGLDRETSTLIWLRSFDDDADRIARKAEYYGSEWWLEREAFAMGHVFEYDVVFADALWVHEGGTLTEMALTEDGERAGTRADAPPAGWVLSTRRSFVPER